MICNLHILDRMIRILVGTVLLLVSYFGDLLGFTGWPRGLAFAMGLYALLSGAVGFCPTYKIFGIKIRVGGMDGQG